MLVIKTAIDLAHFFIVIGVVLLVLFIGSDMAKQVNFYYFFYFIYVICLFDLRTK